MNIFGVWFEWLLDECENLNVAKNEVTWCRGEGNYVREKGERNAF